MRDLSDWLALAVLVIVALLIILIATAAARPHPVDVGPRPAPVSNLAPGCVKLPHYLCIQDRCGYIWIMNCGRRGLNSHQLLASFPPLAAGG